MTTSDQPSKVCCLHQHERGGRMASRVQGGKHQSHLLVSPVSILERVSLQEVSYPMGLDSGGKGSAKVR